MTALIERRTPTHILTVQVPLFIPPNQLQDAGLKFDAFQDALRIVGSLSRLAWEDYLADGITATTEEGPLESPAPA